MQLGFRHSFQRSLRARRAAARRRARSSPSSARSTPRCASVWSRRGSKPPAGREESDLLVALAPHVEDFLARLFGIEAEAQALAERHNELAPLYSVKRLFVQRRALHKVKPEDAKPARFPFHHRARLRPAGHRVAEGRERERRRSSKPPRATPPGRRLTPEGKAKHRSGVLFKTPHKLDFMRLVPVHTETARGFPEHTLPQLRQREGFELTDQGTDLVGALDEANYCIWCHEQGKDSCSKGLKEKAPATGFRKTVFGVPLAGCPLEEKISEFHMVKARGEPLAALGIIAVDNPMAAATGHRICNDCMKSCIYQKQDPVDIPQAETRTLKDVLELPWGFEIYSLLTRWNPFDLRRPYPRESSGKRVLVVGLGPAGFTLAHHLMNDGHTVVGIDGLKIEPLEADISGVDALGNRNEFVPIKDIAELREPLDRALDGGLRRRRRVRHHRALGQELPQDHPPAARAAAAVRDVRRRALRRHADHRRGVRRRLRPYRAVRRRRPADGARDSQRLRARRARGLRLPDGAAAHRRREARIDRQPADPPADRGHRRRPDRDRHRDRIARLLRGAGREVPRPLRSARDQAGLERRGARDRRGIHRPCPGSARRVSSQSACRCSRAGAAPPSPTAAA